MTLLTLLLGFKIIVTLIFVSGPFLLLPKDRLEAMTGAQVQSAALFRLYGMAATALLFGYGTGLWQGLQGNYPWGIILMGLVSNGGAAAILIGTGPKQRPMAALFGGIAVALILSALFPTQSIAPII